MKPRISIVTPCFNMARYLKRTLDSLVSQDHKNAEFIVMDGGSTDGSLEILRDYHRHLHAVHSQQDDGNYDALNRGFSEATGDVFGWLNADDIYYPWTLRCVADIFEQFPDVDWITGLPGHLSQAGQYVRVAGVASAYPQRYLQNGWYRPDIAGYLQQESMFWRRSLWERTGGLNVGYRLAADFDLWTRFANESTLVAVNTPLAAFRRRPSEQLSSAHRDEYLSEVRAICSSLRPPSFCWRFAQCFGIRGVSLMRLLVWRHAEVIGYHFARGQFIRQRVLRPLSRESLSSALLESTLLK